ncbi:LysR family transcriptional regulator [Bacillaceae bacterium W0354]
MKTFITVSELKNFRKAAEALYVSQPTVTVHIQALEKELGVTLFERNQRHVKLTEEGRLYLPYALTSFTYIVKESIDFIQRNKVINRN